MNRSLLFSGLLALFAFSSCETYQYVSPMPATPQFKEAGEVQGQLAVGFNHYEVQGSASFTNFLGGSFTAFKAPYSLVKHYTLHSFFNPNRNDRNRYLSFNLGYIQAHLENGAGDHLPLIGRYIRPYTSPLGLFASDYEGLTFGMDTYWYTPKKRISISAGIQARWLKFYQLDRYSFPSLYYPTHHWHLNGTQQYAYITPRVVATVYTQNKMFFLRGGLFMQMPITPAMNGTHIEEHKNIRYSNDGVLNPEQSLMTYSLSVGFNMNLLRYIRGRKTD